MMSIYESLPTAVSSVTGAAAAGTGVCFSAGEPYICDGWKIN